MGATRMAGRVRPGELVGLLEISHLLDVHKETTWRWRHRKLLPEPVAVCSGTPIWTRRQIEAWATATGRLPVLYEVEADDDDEANDDVEATVTGEETADNAERALTPVP